MTDTELLKQLSALDRRRSEEHEQAERNYKDARRETLDRYAAEHASFRAGDVIEADKNQGRITIRVERVSGEADPDSCVIYAGQLLFPDLKPNGTTTRYSVREDARHKPERLTRSRYEAFRVRSTGSDTVHVSYLAALGKAKELLTGPGEDVTLTGILPDGKERVLQEYTSIKGHIKTR